MTITGQGLQTWWRSRQEADAVQWVRVSAEMTALVSNLAMRKDLVAVVEPGGGQPKGLGAPALYDPSMAHVAIDATVCAPGADPADISLVKRIGQLRCAALTGAGDHESAHGHIVNGTRWTIDQNPARRSIVKAALLIEEPRVERYHLLNNPGRRKFLRAAFSDLVGASPVVDGMRSAAHNAALTAGRVDADVLDAEEVAPLIARCTDILGADVFARLRAVWLTALWTPEPTQAQMEALGQRWLWILEDAGAEPEERRRTLVLVCGERSDESGDGDLNSVATGISADAEAEARSEADAEAAKEAAAERAAEAASRARAERIAAEVFELDLERTVTHGKGHGSEALLDPRPPTDGESAQANVLAAAISRARFRDHARTTVRTTAPPGRLDTAKALKRSAEIAIGLPPTTPQWRRTKRTYTERPPLSVGIGCDISGSMRFTAPAVSSACWVLAQAVHRNGGRLAAVAYGEHLHPLIAPGVRPGQVRQFRALGGTEDWTGAMRALDGALHLRDGSGVRLAVFLSDGHYTSRQRGDGESIVAGWIARGVKVLWLGFHGTGGNQGDIVPPGAAYAHLSDPAQIGSTIGRAMVDLLERA